MLLLNAPIKSSYIANAGVEAVTSSTALYNKISNGPDGSYV